MSGEGERPEAPDGRGAEMRAAHGSVGDGGSEPGASTLPTVGLPATAHSSAGAGSFASSVEPESDVLLAEEAGRARGWAVITIMLAAAAIGFTPLLPMQTEMRWLFIGVLVFDIIPFSAWILWRTRDASGYTNRAFRVWGWSSALGAVLVVYCLGVFSPTPLVVTLGISFFGFGIDRRHALAIPVVAICGYLGLAALITFGLVEDRGMSVPEGSDTMMRVFWVVMVPFVLGVTLWFARLSRGTMIEAIRRSKEALRLAGQREAQLVEAQQNLEMALRVGAGHGGRYTGRRAGSYELAEVVGRGAMGEVYAASHVDDGGRAAVKLLHPEARQDGNAVTRFLREGEVAGSLDVSNVVAVYEVGTLEESMPYIAMELLHGEDLSARVRRRRQLPPGEVLDMARQVARGLDAAHAAGIVHRDLKPQNLFCDQSGSDGNGVWKILDFGVSKLIGSKGTLTQHAVVGTPGYMAPEQARGNAADERADVFSFGAVLYRSIVGRPPFNGPDMPQILFDIVYNMPPRPSELVEHLPHDVDRVLALALAKKPGDRFASAGELCAALAAAFSRSLSRQLRQRASRLVAEHPWGSATSPADPDRGRPRAP